jgi:quinol-cytochrome oxidoreductase complex cytochrome b subunit
MFVSLRILEPKRATAFLVAIGPWSGIAAWGVIAVTDIVLSVVTPGYDAVGETTSQLMSEDARYSTLARVGLATYSVLLIPFALLVTSHFRALQPLALLRTGALWTHILAGLVAASFQNDSSQDIISGITVNRIHDRSAEVLFAAAFLAVTATAITARGLESRRIAWTSAIVAVVMALTGLGLVFDILPVFTGIEERAGLFAFLIWVAVISLVAAHSRRSGAHSVRGEL